MTMQRLTATAAVVATVGMALWAAGSVRGAEKAPSREMADVLGVAHVDGKYYLTDQDFLDEGADQVLATGSRTIKLYLTPVRYPWNSHWPSGIKGLAEMAQTPYFRSVFAKPFKTYILTAYAIGRPDHYWTEGISDEQKADETKQFYDLAKYLLTQYRGTGKTFVLQHWEGDWALRDAGDHSHIYDAKYAPPEKAVEGMIEWINARQAGIVKAREEVKDTDVHVYGATEANRLENSMEGMPGVANAVLPRTNVDLVSYSSYNFTGTKQKLDQAVDYLVQHLPPTAVFGRNAHSVYLGEYGWPENGEGGAEELNKRMNNVVAVAKERGLPWVVYWQVYCNEPVNNRLKPPLNGKENDKNLRGYWLVRPDATPGTAWHRHRELMAAADPGRATSAGAKKGLELLFQDKFDRPDGTEIGPGWKQDAHYGPISGMLQGHKFVVKFAEGKTIPWTSATLDLTSPHVLGRGLKVGEYVECTMRRTGKAGSQGVELYDSDQLRQGSGIDAGESPLQAWDGTTWETFSIDGQGQSVAYDWTREHVLGVRLDTADGHFATYSYYVDGKYAGSWLVKVGWKTLDKFGFWAQTKTDGATMEFTDLKIYGRK